MTFKVRRLLLRPAIVRRFIRWMKRVRLTSHQDISLYRFVRVFIQHMLNNELIDRANGVAYNFILAVFPAIIFMFTLIPYVGYWFPDVDAHSIMGVIAIVLPQSMMEAVESTVLDIIKNQRGGLLTFGFFTALFLSTNGMMALMRAFNACYHTVENRSAWRMRLTATALTLMLSVALVLTVLLLIAGQVIINLLASNIAHFSAFNMDGYTIYLLLALRFVVIFVVLFLVISLIYYFGPSIHENWRIFSVGSFTTAAAILATSHAFSYYITHFGAYNKIYGSIGALIALIVLIQLISLLLLFGYEINSSLHHSVKIEAMEAGEKNR